MHFTLQQLRLFDAVYRNQSYTRAARELFLSQPAVSIQIKRLEEQAGTSLFETVGKKIFPTSAGKAMFEASQDILNRVKLLKNTMEELKGEVTGPLQIAVVTTAKYFMPHLLGQFLKNYPDVEPKLIFTNRAKVMDRLINNQDDFVIMGQIPDDGRLEAHPFLENIIVPVASPSHPLAGKKNLPLESLKDVRFLMREPGSGTRLVFERLLESKGVSIEHSMELGSSEAIKQGVMAGLGVSILSIHSIELERNAGKLIMLDIEGFPLKRLWYAVHSHGSSLSLTAKTFLDYILNEGHHVLNIEL